MSRPSTLAELDALAEQIVQPLPADVALAKARQLVRDAYEVGYADGESSALADIEARTNP